MAATRVAELVLWKDLTPLPVPLHTPTAFSPCVLIIGGGVTGLVTAWTLLDKGYHVTILAKEWASYGKQQRLTSQIAGALWEYPPGVCGAHVDEVSLQHSKQWTMVSYHIYNALAACNDLPKPPGVAMKQADFFFPFTIEDDASQLSKMHEITTSGVQGFRRSAAIIQERGISPTYGVVDAYEYLAPVIDTDACMAFLTDLVSAKGATFVTRTLHGDLLTQEQRLRDSYHAAAIVNATGLAASELAADSSCYPMRGALLRAVNDGRHFPKVDCALAVAADVGGGDATEIVYLVPRNASILLIGGVAEPGEAELDLTLDSPIVRRMRARCEAFLPGLKEARLDAGYPLAQGVRPFREQNVRVERELRALEGATKPSRIVHAYGQGGSGWSVCFGCAGDVVKLVEEALLELPAWRMAI